MSCSALSGGFPPTGNTKSANRISAEREPLPFTDTRLETKRESELVRRPEKCHAPPQSPAKWFSMRAMFQRSVQRNGRANLGRFRIAVVRCILESPGKPWGVIPDGNDGQEKGK